MATNWIDNINTELDRLGVSPALEAAPIQGAPQWVAWVDTQELTILNSPEGVYRTLTTLSDTADIEDIWHAIHSNINEEAEESVEWSRIHGYYKV